MKTNDKHKELTETLTSFWKQTTEKLDEVKDAVVRSVNVGRKRLDVVFLKKQEEKLFEDLGRIVYSESKEKKSKLPPSSQKIVKKIKEIEMQISEDVKESAKGTQKKVKPNSRSGVKKTATRKKPTTAKTKLRSSKTSSSTRVAKGKKKVTAASRNRKK